MSIADARPCSRPPRRGLPVLLAGSLALALGAPLLAGQQASLSGQWKVKAVADVSGQNVSGKQVFYLTEAFALVSGFSPVGFPGCDPPDDLLSGVHDGEVFAFTWTGAIVVPKGCETIGQGEVSGTLTQQDAILITGSGVTALQLDSGESIEVPTELKFKKVSGLQTPDDPDGPGPGVAVGEIGSGEPGSGGAHDLAVTRILAPRHVPLVGGAASVTRKVVVQIQNRGQHAEVIADEAILAQLVSLEVLPLSAGCGSPVVGLHAGKPQKPLPLLLAPRKKLNVVFDVTFACAIDPAKTTPTAPHDDYLYRAAVHHELMGGLPDDHPEDDVAPRGVPAPYVFDAYPDGKIKDRGAGAKLPDGTLGGDVLTDLVVKP